MKKIILWGQEDVDLIEIVEEKESATEQICAKETLIVNQKPQKGLV